MPSGSRGRPERPVIVAPAHAHSMAELVDQEAVPEKDVTAELPASACRRAMPPLALLACTATDMAVDGDPLLEPAENVLDEDET